MSETLRQKQSRFVRYVGVLINYATANGYELTFGEAWRTPEQARWYAEQGKGIVNSLHRQRLAIDLNLFVGNIYLTHVDSYRPLGEFWKSLAPDCRWGGDFKDRADAGHFSIEHEGVK